LWKKDPKVYSLDVQGISRSFRVMEDGRIRIASYPQQLGLALVIFIAGTALRLFRNRTPAKQSINIYSKNIVVSSIEF
jgi:hypothetical protein